jgi:DNA-binding FadR family transcriptional regulator
MTGESTAVSIAGRLADEIVDRDWPIGEVIGSEAELIERMGVSRGVLREAARIVESYGIARMRRGPGGGLVVTAPSFDAVATSVALCLRFERASRRQLFELRVVIELAAAAQAAARVDERSAERLRACVAAERSRGYGDTLASARPHSLHLLIAELSGNPAMRMFGGVLTQLTSGGAEDRTVAPKVAAAYGASHHLIAEAIVSGDAPLAQLRMRRHLEAVAPVFADDDPLAAR